MRQQLSDHPVPGVSLGVVTAVGAVSHDVDGVVEAQDLGDLVYQVNVVALIPIRNIDILVKDLKNFSSGFSPTICKLKMLP